MLILQETLYLKCDLAQFTPEIFLTILRYQRHFLRNWGKLKIACHKLYSVVCRKFSLQVSLNSTVFILGSWLLWRETLIPLHLGSSFVGNNQFL